MIKSINKYLLPNVIITAIMLLNSCIVKPDIEKERLQLLHLHKEQGLAHLQKNVKNFVDQFAANMLSVSNGKISKTLKDSAIKRFDTYFRNIQFSKWEDVNPPVIDISADASMAYMLVDKLVVLKYSNKEEKLVEETTHFAWVSVFKKQEDGQWKIVCNISTNEPAVSKVLE